LATPLRELEVLTREDATQAEWDFRDAMLAAK
jgi:hypothetical protein